jgi:hypothetical protein
LRRWIDLFDSKLCGVSLVGAVALATFAQMDDDWHVGADTLDHGHLLAVIPGKLSQHGTGCCGSYRISSFPLLLYPLKQFVEINFRVD